MPKGKRTTPPTAHSRAKAILQAVAEGIHPKTKDELPSDSVVNDIDVNRAIRAGLAAIEHLEARAARRAFLPEGVGKNWTDEEHRQLRDEYANGIPIPDIAEAHKRTVRAIEARLERMGLIAADQRTTTNSFTGAPAKGDEP
jgi:hypothetical protein